MAALVDLDQARIERALERRARYRYVRPRVLAEPEGFRIVSPNCSRSVQADGAEIDIARLLRRAGHWELQSRDHDAGRWLHAASGPLPELLRLLALDPSRLFWL
ncbi:MAG: hypothetical protein U1F56_09800 [Rubrivivax sp.]